MPLVRKVGGAVRLRLRLRRWTDRSAVRVVLEGATLLDDALARLARIPIHKAAAAAREAQQPMSAYHQTLVRW